VIFYYLLVSVMPMIQHPLWASVLGEFTLVKYLGFVCFGYALIYAPSSRTTGSFFSTWQIRWFMILTGLTAISWFLFGRMLPFEISPLMSFISFCMFFITTLIVVDSLDRLRYVLLVALGSVVYASLHVIREWQKYGGMASGYRPGWVTGDPNYYSLSVVLLLPLAFYMLKLETHPGIRWFIKSFLVLGLFGLTLAASRGALLGLGVSIVFFGLRSPKRLKFFVIAAVVLLPLMAVAPSSPLSRLISPDRHDQHSADTRTALWQAGWEMAKENPLTGIGAGNFKMFVWRYKVVDNTPTNIAHNTYVEALAEMGFPGLIAFLGVIVATFISLERLRKSTREKGPALVHASAEAIQVGLVGYVFAIVFVSSMAQKLFWLLIFLTVTLHSLARQANPPEAPAEPVVVKRRRRPVPTSTS
jgi:O-antigen ligase